MSKFCVTLKQLRNAGACVAGYNKLVCHLKGIPFQNKEKHIIFRHYDTVNITTIVESNGLDDALWSLQCVNGCDRDLRLYAIWCALQVHHLADYKCNFVLRIAEEFANGNTNIENLAAAGAAAGAAARDAARDAAGDAWAAAGAAARDAAWAAARDAAGDAGAAAGAAARDAAWDAWAAAGGAWDAAWAAARDAAGDAQKEMLIKMCNNQAPWQQSGWKGFFN